jgi:hypothetical protein
MYGRAQWLDERRHVSSGRELRHEAFDLAFASKASAGQHLAVVFFGEIRREQQDPGQMDGGVGEHAEQHRELAGDARCAAAALRFVFGETKLIDAVGREGVARVR